mmetsp:Transcript_29850/g.41236  ORF Transcript_29850/g.41236 Transcript_29850/m.41236 type:complete len:193 (+) Transcript_29850:49-627(+)|eukprot:CAMPEP_0201484180 /NCGR_PEP_ID=MMETSP0151_2-20130828/8381_1 /ASSEMBLY_ACC=CAM_ASM_000257 /TAXON_ID=200890 /ORGANISM="Paramoeba atlantica, Strain 621/1 / CCAP 1560/9" /LENGTH=192 /DNA_ID=CAMNT_0047867721 /DNA_START=49 /DNA_END=627 /DNA_ORIENTATION=-
MATVEVLPDELDQVHINEGSASEDEVPELEEIHVDQNTAGSPERNVKQNRSQRRYAKVMGKMGMKPEGGITRVTIRKAKNITFAISQPEVYKYPGTDAYIVFGEAAIEDRLHDAQKAAVRQFTQAAGMGMHGSPTDGLPVEEEEDGDISAEGIDEKDIELVMAQAAVTRNKSIRALRANDGDIVNTIMSLTM